MRRLLLIIGLLAFAGGGFLQGAPVTNDNFATRMRIVGEKVTVTASSAEATREEGEPGIFHGLGVTLWWSFTAPKSGKVRLTGVVGDEMWPYPDVRGLIFTGDALSNLTAYSPWGFLLRPDGSAPVAFETVAGTEYQILTDTVVPAPFIGYRGPVTLSFEYLPSPVNDNLAARTVIAGEALIVQGSNEGATRETGEPAHAGAFNEHTVWYEWTAPADGSVNLSLLRQNESGLTVAAYTSELQPAMNTLAPVAMNGCCGFTARAGGRYYIAVASPFNDTAPFEMALSLNGRPVIKRPVFTHYGVVVDVFGSEGGTYRVESSTNLMDWLPLTTPGYVDESPVVPARFYRAVLVP